MDTRSKKFKYTFFAKILCLILSAICIFTAATGAMIFMQASAIYGFEEFLKRDFGSFNSCSAFNDRITNDIYKITQLASESSETLNQQLSTQSDEKVAEAVAGYLDQKAYIIQSELEYAVNNYDDSYFNYEYSADLVTIPEATTNNVEPSTVVIEEPVTEYTGEPSADEVLPRNIEAAQKILESASGRDFLNYEALVRDSAFDTDYSYTCEIVFYDADANYSSTTITFTVGNMLYSESQIIKEFYDQYNNWEKEYISNYTNDFYSYEYDLDLRNNLHYYTVSAEDNIYTNLKEKPDVASIIKKNTVYAIYDGNTVQISGFDDKGIAESVEDDLKNSTGKEIYIYLEADLSSTKYDDIYSDMYHAYIVYQNYDAATLIALCVICLIIAVLFLIALLCLCGHTNDYEKIKLAYIDRLPTDIHFILSFGLIFLAAALLLGILDITVWDYYNPYSYYKYIAAITGAITAVCWMLLTEWLTSTGRIKKCGYSFFKRTLIAKFIGWICKKFRKLKNKIVKAFSYKPQKMQKQTIMLIIGYVVANLLILVLAAFATWVFYEGIVTFVCIGVFITFNVLVAIFFMKYIRMFDDIITASCEHRNVDFGNENVPEELRLLSDNLANSNQQLEEAIAQAIKDEQMKTELITNVSHDLKTPLTSLITYSDLLSKCNITDENAVKYTNVINQQSIKLKRLIEDLIEASKVSTGNVTLNKSVLNLSELAVQAIVEFAPETEKNGNEIKFDEPEIAPKVYADGSKTYRIISNLLSNAKKYSAPYTRIYVSVYSDGINGYFEIKNISAEPLNISPDELTERFVRGDKSRSREGNGLGLSIAKDLCTIQDGELKLIIDGDLFKAIVKLPCKQGDVIEVETTESDIQPE